MDIVEILKEAVEKNASDIFMVVGRPVTCKVSGQLVMLSEQNLDIQGVYELIKSIYEMSGNRSITMLENKGDDDFSFSLRGVSRFRVSAYKQRGTFAAVIRIIQFSLPDPQKLGIPETVMKLAEKTKGLILVTGPAGSGKSTTLACLIDKINRTRQNHIITLEDPLEYLHQHQKSIVSQREINSDTEGYLHALRAALRQAPDVILLGEMRDYETIMVAMTAAETGHLVISSLHTLGAANTIDRIIDVFPSSQQRQIQVQLSMVLQAAVSQQLLTSVDGEVIPAFEIMIVNNAIQNMIRDSKVHQIDSVIQTSSSDGMINMDSYMLRLYNEKKITKETAIIYAANPDLMRKKIGI